MLVWSRSIPTRPNIFSPDILSASERNHARFSPCHNSNAFFGFSAMMHSENVTTPLLVLHGAARVPTYQGREYFEILAAARPHAC